MKRSVSLVKVVVGVLGALLVFAASVEARSVSAFKGQAQNFADNSYFFNTRGIVIGNDPSTARQWCVAMEVDATANHTVTSSVSSPDWTHIIRCQAWRVNTGGTITWSSGWNSPGSVGSVVTINLGTVNVPAGNTLYECCDIPQNATWVSSGW